MCYHVFWNIMLSHKESVITAIYQTAFANQETAEKPRQFCKKKNGTSLAQVFDRHLRILESGRAKAAFHGTEKGIDT